MHSHARQCGTVAIVERTVRESLGIGEGIGLGVIGWQEEVIARFRGGIRGTLASRTIDDVR